MRYSNYGAGTLGEALTRALDAPFGELVARRITGPLSMGRTDITLPSEVDNGAQGHLSPGKPVPDWHVTGLAGAGALRSTLTGLLVFLDAQLRPTESSLAHAIDLAMPLREKARGPMRDADRLAPARQPGRIDAMVARRPQQRVRQLRRFDS